MNTKKIMRSIFIPFLLLALLAAPFYSNAQCFDQYGDPEPCPGGGSSGGAGSGSSGSNGVQCSQTVSAGNRTIGKMFEVITCIIYQSFIPMLFALATAIFIWGVVMYVINTQDENKREKGKQYIVWGLVGLAVIISIWGLVAILGVTFLGSDFKAIIPSVPN